MNIEEIKLGLTDATKSVFSNTLVSKQNFAGLELKLNEIIEKLNELSVRVEAIENS